MIINLNENINSSLQVGDTLYYVTLNDFPLSNDVDPILIGKVTNIDGNSIETEETAATPNDGDFLMFVKNNKVNTSGLKGYYAKARLELQTASVGKLFSVSAEVSESSK
tara:strand:+ start:4536 stop:4862 length:327 start_codon:yes stop_codon:yes gene_type:complete